MKEISCRLLVIGAGPGGYVCAIRAGQLGIDTVIVEAIKTGGTCLNVGCIPSKALIHAADEFDKLERAASGGNRSASRRKVPVLDLGRAVAWKDGIVGRLTTGVSGLLKKAGVKSISGRARFRDGKTVEVETETGVQAVRAEAVVIATGSEPVELPPALRRLVISSTEALALTELPRAAGGGRRRLYRPGARHGLRQARQQGDRGRGAAAHPAAVRRRADPPGGRRSRSWASSC
jgi:dihydrolipoamide dehydrogenase